MEDLREGQCERGRREFPGYTSGDRDFWARPLHVQKQRSRKAHCLPFSKPPPPSACTWLPGTHCVLRAAEMLPSTPGCF